MGPSLSPACSQAVSTLMSGSIEVGLHEGRPATVAPGNSLLCLGYADGVYGRLLVKVDRVYGSTASGCFCEVTAVEVSSSARPWWRHLTGPTGTGLIHLCGRDASGCKARCERPNLELVLHVTRGAVVNWNDANVQQRGLAWMGSPRASSMGPLEAWALRLALHAHQFGPEG